MLRLNLPRRTTALLIATSLILTACAGATTTPPVSTQPPVIEPLITVVQGTPAPESTLPSGGTTPAAPPESAPAGAITIAFVQDFDTLNPMYAQALSSIYTQAIWNCRAWNFDDQNNPIPILVAELPSLENGGISADGRVITMKLRQDIHWSDGTPITAQDFVFTYQMITDTDNAVSSITPYDLVEGVSASDPTTVVITFKQPYAAWLSALWKYLLPSHVLQPVYDSQGSLQNAPWNIAPTPGCGPYIFQSWENGVSARFTANENYWMGRPRAAEIIIRLVADDNAKVSALHSGEADLSVFLSNASLFTPALKQAGANLIPVNSGYQEGWFFYLDPTNGHPALQDVHVRQALALSIDRVGLVNRILGDIPTVVETYWDQSPYVDPTIQAWAYDPARAAQLLEDAGWVDTNGNGSRDKDGVELSLTYGTTINEVRQAVQQEIQAQLAQVGIKVEISNHDSGTFFMGYNEGGPAATGQLDIFQYAPRTKNYPDPGTNDFLCAQIPSNDELGENWSWLCNEELDQLLQLQATQIDFTQRQATFHQISKLIHDQVFFLGLWTDPDLWASGPRLSNVHISGITPFFNIYEWELAQ